MIKGYHDVDSLFPEDPTPEQLRDAVYNAAMDLSDKLGDLWLGWFIAEDKLPEQYRPIVAAVDALVRECRRAKEGSRG